MRRIFVGDIQGCREQLEALLAAVEFTRGADVLYPAGDLVNKGPDSDGTLRLLMELDAQPVLGNHDVYALANGLLDDAAGVEWLRAQPFARVMDDLILVHAGLHPQWTEADLSRFDLDFIHFVTNVRYCDAEGERPEQDWPVPGEPYRPWYEFYTGEKRVVFGHWARQGLYRGERVIGLDSGCVYGNPLTAWIAEEDRIVQVDGPPN